MNVLYEKCLTLKSGFFSFSAHSECVSGSTGSTQMNADMKKMNDLISLKLSLEDGDVKAAEDLHEDLLAQQRVHLACRTQLISHLCKITPEKVRYLQSFTVVQVLNFFLRERYRTYI